MNLVRGEFIAVEDLLEPEPILFILSNGSYYYVEQGIVENELRVMKNWETAERTDAPIPWVVSFYQGTMIPQELGDYLLAHECENQTTNHTQKADKKPED